ncbi:ESX secretion-associated protein EspG [Amycolatopsis sp. PS_44_ISF1]|uniref:ESX secretion-associated protein EspG n=1 Tax=Amycolatopsis sp. PS_44_ISF1 TaxID=2974917 RepID=UPI0028DDB9F1|nr:ESX secretion-associated protein EspG [Amycolatopsis sp. PS_44_ISF1]MDT8914855.1 ESX secretion-associated protein EspG [Amycolatopsis sp. PS_44_ISF1]
MIRVSASAFDVLWTDLGLGPPPVPLTVRSVGSTTGERAEIRAEVYRNLGERGLFDGRSVDPVLEGRLRLLDGAERLVAGEALVDMTAEVPFRAVAAVRGRSGVLAVQPSQTIALSGIRGGELGTAIVELLPELGAGPGYGVSLPAEQVAGAEDSLFGGRGARTAAAAAAPASAASAAQVREVLAIQARPVYAAGQFSAYARGTGGRVTRLGGFTWFDTDVGAYCASTSAGRGGQDWVNVSPVDGARLAERITGLFASD